MRLIEPEARQLPWFTASRRQETPQWQVAPLYRLFGSEELSQRSAVFRKRMSPAMAVLHPSAAASLGINAGKWLSIECGNDTVTLPVVFSEHLPAGLVGLPSVCRAFRSICPA